LLASSIKKLAIDNECMDGNKRLPTVGHVREFLEEHVLDAPKELLSLEKANLKR
jgi:hypothetical protein